MKRITILLIILVLFASPCPGVRRTRQSSQTIIQLTDPNTTGDMSFEKALTRRRSVRQFSTRDLKRAQIGQLAWAGQGVTDEQRGFRTAPSAQALYPMELYIATNDGLYTYQPKEHSLGELSDQDIRSQLARATMTPEPVATAPCSIIIAGSSREIAARVGNKARTFVAMEAGHIAQNIQLQAVCMGLGSVPIGGLDSAAVRRVCNMARGLEPLYVIPVGYPVGAVTDKGKAAAETKRAALFIPSTNFRDDELFTTKRMLDAAQIETVIASTKLGTLRGALGGMAEARVLVDQLNVDNYDAIIFISGPPEYVGNPVAINLVREAVRKDKVVAAIGVAPTILASADVLTGIRATAFLSERDRLVRAGAIYTGLPVERERLIITATGATAARPFGRMIAEALTVK